MGLAVFDVSVDRLGNVHIYSRYLPLNALIRVGESIVVLVELGVTLVRLIDTVLKLLLSFSEATLQIIDWCLGILGFLIDFLTT